MRGAVACLVCVAVVAGCSGSDDETTNALTIEGNEYAYVVDGEAAAGVVSMRFVNTGEQLHEFALGRIDGDQTVDDAVSAISEGDGDAPWLDDVAGVPLLSPGEEVTVTRTLEAGRYALLCFFPSPNGEPHVALGMKGEFELGGESDATLPDPDAVIVATPDGYEVSGLSAGTQTIELRNESGREPSWYLAAAQPGKTIDDFEAWIEAGQNGEAPLTFYGAMQSFPDGESVFVTLELVAGTTYRLEDDPGGLPGVEFTPS